MIAAKKPLCPLLGVTGRFIRRGRESRPAEPAGRQDAWRRGAARWRSAAGFRVSCTTRRPRAVGLATSRGRIEARSRARQPGVWVAIAIGGTGPGRADARQPSAPCADRRLPAVASSAPWSRTSAATLASISLQYRGTARRPACGAELAPVPRGAGSPDQHCPLRPGTPRSPCATPRCTVLTAATRSRPKCAETGSAAAARWLRRRRARLTAAERDTRAMVLRGLVRRAVVRRGGVPHDGAPAAPGIRVLIADDQRVVRRARCCRAHRRRPGCRDRQRRLRSAPRRSTPPDVILMDPDAGMDGIAATGQLRSVGSPYWY